jgi:hypothetical protein
MISWKNREPVFTEPNAIDDAVNFHLGYIKAHHHPGISRFLQDLREGILNDNKEIKHINSQRFTIGEVLIYPKGGKLHLTCSDEEILKKAKTLSDEHYNGSTELEILKYDDDYTLIVEFADSLLWH